MRALLSLPDLGKSSCISCDVDVVDEILYHLKSFIRLLLCFEARSSCVGLIYYFHLGHIDQIFVLCIPVQALRRFIWILNAFAHVPLFCHNCCNVQLLFTFQRGFTLILQTYTCILLGKWRLWIVVNTNRPKSTILLESFKFFFTSTNLSMIARH